MATAKNTICLWFDNDFEVGARLYAEMFPDSSIGAIQHVSFARPPGKAGARR